MKKAVLYARVSSKEQQKGFSVPAQLKLLRGYAKENSIAIVEEFTEAESAKCAGRTAFRRMVDYLEGHADVRIILAEKTDRLYRNFRDYVDLDFEAMGLELHLVKEHEMLSSASSSHAKLTHGLKVVLAKNYLDNLSEEVRKGQTEKAEQGMWPSAAPIGYANIDKAPAIIPHVDEGPLVTKMFELAATGSYALKDLCQTSYDLGLRSRRAKRKLGKERMRQLLSNPIYYGDFRWKGILYRGKHEPLVSKELLGPPQNSWV